MDPSIDSEYESIALLEHKGKETEHGHWTCTKKIIGKRWFCNNAEVSELSNWQLRRHKSASTVALKKVSREYSSMSLKTSCQRFRPFRLPLAGATMALLTLEHPGPHIP